MDEELTYTQPRVVPGGHYDRRAQTSRLFFFIDKMIVHLDHVMNTAQTWTMIDSYDRRAQLVTQTFPDVY